MPGAARMYPETDIKPILVTKKLLKSIELPELLDEKILNLEKQGVNPDLARNLVKEGFFLDEFNYNLNKNLIASVLVEMPKEVKKRFNLDYHFQESDFRLVLEGLNSKSLNKESAFEVLTEIAQGKKIDLSKYKQVDLGSLEKDIKQIVEKNKNLTSGALMGIVMGKYRGKVEGKVVSELISKYKS
jgi:glutamyl-tRNA(Gln) amidotransferase subunit E